jgi:outer membrane protein assembly factor BamB
MRTSISVRARVVALSTVAALTLLTGCSTGADGQPAAAPPMQEAWKTTGLDVVSSPVIVKDSVVVYATAPKKGLRIVALDAATGKLRWQQPATPSELRPSDGVWVTHSDTEVYYLRPVKGDDYDADVVAADAVTGKVKWVADWSG